MQVYICKYVHIRTKRSYILVYYVFVLCTNVETATFRIPHSKGQLHMLSITLQKASCMYIILIFENQLFPYTAIQQRQYTAAVGCRNL
jgi:hypothetical protein